MFEISVLDTEFNRVATIDVFKSFIWSERYQEAGQFELYIDPGSEEFKKIKEDYYLDLIKDDNLDISLKSLMIVEDFKLVTNEENGNSVSISGRSLPSLLDRRIVWEPTIYSGPLQEGVRLLLEKNVINPKNENRKIDNFVFVESNDEELLKIGIEIEANGQSVYQILNEICQVYGVGYKMRYDFSDGKMYFNLYIGANRGLNNPDDNLVIEFSPRNDNLLSSNYTKTNSKFKNTILIGGGEGEGDKRYFTSLNNNKKGMKRKEAFVSSSLKFGENKEERLSFPEYERQLKEEGRIQLKNYEDIEVFDGDVLARTDYDIYILNKDFFLGDIVYIENEYKQSCNSIISEIVESYDEKGYNLIPTFTKINKMPTKITGTIYIDNDNRDFTIKNITKPVTIIWGDGKVDKDISGTITHTYEGSEEDACGLYDFYIIQSDNKDIDFCPSFEDSKVLYKIEIPNKVQELQEKTFSNCNLLTSIILPPSLKILQGEKMFYKCDNLYSMVIPNSVTNASANTFQDCLNLVSCNFPYNTEVAPTNYFNNCPKLKDISFPGNSFSEVGVKTIQENVLNNCPKCTDIFFGSLVESINGKFLNGPTEACNIKISRYEPPTLTNNFTVQIGEIEVPNSPKFDDSVLNAYKTAWPNYAAKIKEEYGELEQEKVENNSYSYAEDSEDYDDDDISEEIYSNRYNEEV